MNSNLSTIEKGDHFENTVASVFGAAGFHVEKDLLVGGQQVDLCASYSVPLADNVVYIIECKYISTKKSVSNQDVYDFIAYIKSLPDNVEVTKGLLVSNSKFSKPAKLAAKTSGYVDLKTLHDLENSLLGMRDKLTLAHLQYKEQPIYKNFINLRADGEHEQNYDLLDTIVGDLESDSSNVHLVLGEFGRGKTTVSQKIFYCLADAYLSKKTDKFPVILRLRNLLNYSNINTFIQAEMSHTLKKSFTSEDYWYFANQNRIVSVLDGFDEILTHATKKQRLHFLEKIIPITSSSNGSVLLTRPTVFSEVKELNYFIAEVNDQFKTGSADRNNNPSQRNKDVVKKSREVKNVMVGKVAGDRIKKLHASTTVVHRIKPLSPEQIIEYISKYKVTFEEIYKLSPSGIYSKLSSVYDIKDLLRTPLLLEMMVEVLLEVPLDLNDPKLEIGPSALYENYVDMHFAREWSKGEQRQFLTVDERLHFSRAMAVSMFEMDKMQVSLSEINGIFEKLVKAYKAGLALDENEDINKQIEEITSDIRICSFITLDIQGNFSFIHKSFVEYFVADFIRLELKNNKPISLFRKRLDTEIFHFLGSFCTADSSVRDGIFFQKNIEKESREYRENIDLAIIYCEEESISQTFETSISGININYEVKTFEKCRFRANSWSYQLASTIRFNSCRFDSFKHSGDATNISFAFCTGNMVNHLEPEKTTVVDCPDISIESGSVFSYYEIVNSNITVRGLQVCTDILVSNSIFYFELNQYAGLDINKSIIKGSVLLPVFKKVVAGGVSKNSKIKNPAVRAADIQVNFTGTTMDNVKLIAISISSGDLIRLCKASKLSGVVFTDSSPEMIQFLKDNSCTASDKLASAFWYGQLLIMTAKAIPEKILENGSECIELFGLKFEKTALEKKLLSHNFEKL